MATDSKLADLTPLPSPVVGTDLWYAERGGLPYKALGSDLPTGSGTVTKVSVTTANGVSGSVATDTTTPAITITLGDITPSKVNTVVITGASTPTLEVTGTTKVSGTNTGDQTITLTGDVTGAGTGSFATTVATVNGNVGSFGSATKASTFTVNAKGLLTAAAETTITPAIGSVTGLGANVATALGVAIGSAGAPVLFDGAGGTPSSMTGTNISGTAAGLTAGAATNGVTAAAVIADTALVVGSGGARGVAASTLSGIPLLTSGVPSTSNVTNDAQTKASIVPNTAPAAAEILIGNAGGTAYAKNAVSGDITITSAGVVAVGAGKITPAMQTTAGRTFGISFGKDGGGSALSTGALATAIVVPYASTIVGYNLSCDTGTITWKFWKIATGTAIPTIANVINTSGVAIASGTHIRSSTVTDFTTTTVSAGDIIIPVITAVSGSTWASGQIEMTKT